MHYNHVLHQLQKIKNILKDLEQLNIEKLILNEKLLKSKNIKIVIKEKIKVHMKNHGIKKENIENKNLKIEF